MITFDQLIALYRNTEFAADGAEGKLTIRDHSVLDTVRLIEADDQASRDAGITVKDAAARVGLGTVVRIGIGPPRTGLGQLALNLDGLLANPRHRVAEPARYYLIDERFAYNDTAVIDAVARYRSILRLVRALKEAAAYLNPYDAEMMFLGPNRLLVPVRYRSASLRNVNSKLVDEFENFLLQNVHKDQKAAIVATTIVEMCGTQPEDERFSHVLSNLRDFVSRCEDSYRLFASEFSYEKIKGKAEEAIGDYANKIHNTFHDIQNQVMGIPVATVIIATQLKRATDCGTSFWANLAVSLGATLFVALLTFAVLNQVMTLSTIERDLGRQKGKLSGDYAAVSAEFLSLYARLEKRIFIHRTVLGAILLVCFAGVILTWSVFSRLTAPMPWECF